ncbi:YbhB/YbcL family Raf kinase inhibitor-like protein [Egibacter rhizosphaerae]|uniref:YbhB/YbcL family Raf kinase inhibitor-like protein n=1 Tax=Egibacter rhizosphaerae TaxID=1670831 RepID=A0A411YIA4_9ACTN|nr:YbhB/YbcL family Raf kinase inhibitor-like protein [Egibacter rhizosphaerae]QBI20927.1 YbhB/YbcL family Raf kinase inhibitor-like protein [Egibacter rhizosphaerae]
MGLNIADLAITSPAFKFGERIPTRHTGEGEDVSPELQFHGVPSGTRQLAVICHDPDAPLPHGFTHWVVAGIPPDAGGIPEGGGGRYVQGATDFGKNEYGGPFPPDGHGTHFYYFFLYALDAELDVREGITRLELLDKIQPHMIEMNRLVGTYER